MLPGGAVLATPSRWVSGIIAADHRPVCPTANFRVCPHRIGPAAGSQRSAWYTAGPDRGALVAGADLLARGADPAPPGKSALAARWPHSSSRSATWGLAAHMPKVPLRCTPTRVSCSAGWSVSPSTVTARQLSAQRCELTAKRTSAATGHQQHHPAAQCRLAVLAMYAKPPRRGRADRHRTPACPRRGYRRCTGRCVGATNCFDTVLAGARSYRRGAGARPAASTMAAPTTVIGQLLRQATRLRGGRLDAFGVAAAARPYGHRSAHIGVLTRQRSRNTAPDVDDAFTTM